VVAAAVEAFGAVDVVVANHARSSNRSLAEVTAAELDLTWAVNARASVLLTQAFAAAHDDERPGGRIILFTSGQHLAPMSQELPYAISKGAIHQMTLSLSDALVDRGITVNTLNPGRSTPAGRTRTSPNASGAPCPRDGGAARPKWPVSSGGWHPMTASGSPVRSSTPRAGSAAGSCDRTRSA
jgi:NAD(P)-dependent dehydrogenase (short-subunit alcohol dehydrogenase family)